MFLKAISAALAAALAITQSIPAPVNVASSGDTGALKVMCIGDSITDGYGINGSYRKFLYHGLTEAGYTVDMVGSKTGWSTEYTDEETGETFSYDDDNTGYSGYTIMSYGGRNGIYETVQETGCLSAQPDIVIVQIGTNDVIDNYEIDSSGERLTTLITYILANIPSDSALFVTSIPDLDPNREDVYSWFSNYRHSADWQTQYSDEEVEVNVQASVDKYNSIVASTVTTLQQTYPNLYLGDVNSAITDVAAQLNDGVHPNNAGYKRMGAYWTNVLTSYLNGSAPVVTTTSTQTTAVTTTTTTTTSETTTTTAASSAAETSTETTTAASALRSHYSITDVEAVQDYILGKSDSQVTRDNWTEYDFDENGKIDIIDLMMVRERAALVE